jgi:OOP family OmpA-OmpF porin
MKRGPSERIPDKDAPSRDATQWQDLRELLIGPEQHQLAQVLERLNDPVRRAEELSQSLPDAITIGTSRDNRISMALQPTIDTALKRSAARNPKAIADAIFPALGPAIRKAISAALMGMIQSLNQLLNQSFSLRGVKWRLEAIRSKRSFAEVVLLHTLVYRVEQIFLIHRKSGILLQHVGGGHNDGKDPDLVSGMLTAIQEFVKDSFDSATGEMLDSLRMDGDHSVWIEQGPHAILAAVIRGIPPLELRTRFSRLLDHIHRLYGVKLEDFRGQTSVFAMIRSDLEDALIYKEHEHPARLSRLREQRGIVVTMAEKRGGRYVIAGLKDPLAGGVDAIIRASHLKPSQIQTRWQPYYALDETTVMQRARLILSPPPTVKLAVDAGTLKATGNATHRWIERFRRHAVTIPGIQALDEAGLTDSDMRALSSASADLHQQVIAFKLGQWRIDDAQVKSLTAALKILARIQGLNRSMGIFTKITIIGKTDPTGRRAFNQQLSEYRAWAVMNYMIQHRIDPSRLQAVGAPVPAAKTESQPPFANAAFRTVTFNAPVGTE